MEEKICHKTTYCKPSNMEVAWKCGSVSIAIRPFYLCCDCENCPLANYVGVDSEILEVLNPKPARDWAWVSAFRGRGLYKMCRLP